jgi:hypothetical protein
MRHPLDVLALDVWPWDAPVAVATHCATCPRPYTGGGSCGWCTRRKAPAPRGTTGRAAVPNVGRLWARAVAR